LSWSHLLALIYLPIRSSARSLGLVLCAGKKQETVELLELEPRGIHVAEYLTELPPKEVLERRLHEATLRAKARLEQGGERGKP
jgi:hypothetical protein